MSARRDPGDGAGHPPLNLIVRRNELDEDVIIKAVVYEQYGPPEVLKLAEFEKPKPGEDEILIRVCAAAVNPLDWHFMRGEPRALRIGIGLRRPKDMRFGRDVAVVVEAVGKNVTKLGGATRSSGRARARLLSTPAAARRRSR